MRKKTWQHPLLETEEIETEEEIELLHIAS